MAKALVCDLLWDAFVDISEDTRTYFDDGPAAMLNEDVLFFIAYYLLDRDENIFSYVLKESIANLVLLAYYSTSPSAYVMRRPKRNTL